jgi:hypothetical protein
MVLAGSGDAWIRFLGARDSARLAPASLPANPITRSLAPSPPLPPPPPPPFLSRSVSWNLASYAAEYPYPPNVRMNYIIAPGISRLRRKESEESFRICFSHSSTLVDHFPMEPTNHLSSAYSSNALTCRYLTCKTCTRYADRSIKSKKDIRHDKSARRIPVKVM